MKEKGVNYKRETVTHKIRKEENSKKTERKEGEKRNEKESSCL